MKRYTPAFAFIWLLILGLILPQTGLIEALQVDTTETAKPTAEINKQPIASPSPLVSSSVNVLTRSYDNSRLGANNQEPFLNTTTVTTTTFGKLYTRPVDGQIYAQPLYVSNLNIPGQGVHNVVFVATQHNSVYAFDADDPNASTPLWTVNLGQAAPVPNSDFGNRYGPYHDIRPEIGITSTPVIDLNSFTIYVVNFAKEGTVYKHYLNALDIRTGQNIISPIQIQGWVPGQGTDLNTDNNASRVTFESQQHLQRVGLLLLNNVVYIAFAGYADTNPYHGWVMAYDATTLQQIAVFNDTPNGGQPTTWPPPPNAPESSNGGEGGIWMSGQGIAADAQGYIYLVTGNGTFSANIISNSTIISNGADYGNSLLKMKLITGATPSISVTDYFTPYDWQNLNNADNDLGVGGVILLPFTNLQGKSLALNGSKSGKFYITDSNSLGKVHTSDNNQIIQSFQATAGPSSKHIHGTPVYYNAPTTGSQPITGSTVYVWGENDRLRAYHFDSSTGLFNVSTVSTSTMTVPSGMPGGILTVSSNNSQAGTGVMWAQHPYCGDANPATRPGIIRAFDATDLSKELWNSEMLPLTVNTNACSTSNTPPYSARDRMGYFAKFNPPMVANGKVFAESFKDTTSASNTDPYNGNKLVVYGLLNTVTAPLSTTASLISAPNRSNYGQSVIFTATVTANAGIVPTGIVSFTEGTTQLGTANLDYSGVATFTTSTLVTGTHAIKANYVGAPSYFPSVNYLPAASTYYYQNVGPQACLDTFANISSSSDDGLGTTCNTLSFGLTQAAVATMPVTLTLNTATATITLTNALPTVTNINGVAITIDGGCTQGVPGNAIVAGVGAASIGMTLTTNMKMTGVKMAGFSGYALKLSGNNNTLTCNWLGTLDGTSGASPGGGLLLIGSNNTLGNSSQAQSGNLISGNSGIGIQVQNGSKGNTANYTLVGYAADGTTPLRNSGGTIIVAQGGQLNFGKGNRAHG